MTTNVPARADVPVELTWDLATIYPTDDNWEETYHYVEQQLPKLAELKGSLSQTPGAMFTALSLRDQLAEIVGRIYAYASHRSDQDTSVAVYQGMKARALSLYAQYAAASSWFTPEILAIPADRLQTFLAQEPRLALYQHQLDDITRTRAHVRSAEIEQILAEMTEIADAPNQIFQMISYADMRLPTVQNEQGQDVQLTEGSYGLFRVSTNRAVRQAAFEGLHGAYRQQQNTLATNLATNVKKNVFLANARRYSSAVEMALDAINVPVSVYENLIATVNAHLPTLHRYLAVRKRLLGLDDQHMYDLYAPLVGSVEFTMTREEAMQTIQTALQPLGTAYGEALAKGLQSRWIDWLENQNKYSGAYSSNAYGIQPFILLNYHGKIDDVFTLAHELGHSMHSYFAHQKQPFQYGDYTLFLAEIASTLNESLLTHHLTRTVSDPMVKAYVINHYLDGFRATLFRQTMFADFELQIHRAVESGKALTPDTLCAMYKGLNDRYYGDGGVIVDDLIAWEWARIPHFYYNFYVYQYATGISASAALSRAIVSEGQPAVDRYLSLLEAGSRDYSLPLLHAAGVDLTTPAPIEAAIAEFDQAITELEHLLG